MMVEQQVQAGAESEVLEAELEEGAEGDGKEGAVRQVPVTEAIRYRKRAQEAERALGEARERLAALEGELEEASRTVGALERRERIDALLHASEAVDLEAARLLTERAVSQMDEPDVESAVSELRRTRPYLFGRGRRGVGSGAMGLRFEGESPVADEAAAQAAASGDRRDLLRYLRARREA